MAKTKHSKTATPVPSAANDDAEIAEPFPAPEGIFQLVDGVNFIELEDAQNSRLTQLQALLDLISHGFAPDRHFRDDTISGVAWLGITLCEEIKYLKDVQYRIGIAAGAYESRKASEAHQAGVRG